MKKAFIALLMLLGQTVLGASLSGNITAADGSLGPLYLGAKESATYSLADFGTATIVLQRSQSPNGPWETLASYTANQSSTTYYNQLEQPAYVRLYAKAYTSGTIAATLADVDGDVVETIHFNRYKQQEAIQLDDKSRAVFPNGIVTDGDIDMGAVTMDGPLLVGTTAAAAGIVGHSLATGWLELQGDATSGATGAYMRIYGASHATLANDIVIGSGSTTVLNYDDSAETLQSGYKFVVGNLSAATGAIQLNAGATNVGMVHHSNADGSVVLTAHTGTGGTPNLQMWGGNHATKAADVEIQTPGGNILAWDDSANVLALGEAATTVIRMNTATQATVGAAGAASALPAQPTGYIEIQTNDGTPVVVPYYAKS